MAFAYCLDCGGRIYLGHRPSVGESAFCERCGADLEVAHLNPLTLEWADYLADLERETGLQSEHMPT